jgi:uncharacterized membrane protein
MEDVGISDDFVRQVSAQLRPESSALALMASQGDLDAVLPELVRPGAVLLRTSLSPDAAAHLQAALDGETTSDTSAVA